MTEHRRMTEIAELIERAVRHADMPKRVLADKAGVAAETVTRICRRGTGDFAIVSRLLRSAGLRLAAVPVAMPQQPEPGTIDRDALALHAVIAGKLVVFPALVDDSARPAVRRMKRARARSGPATDPRVEAWQRAARAGLRGLLRLCVDPSETGRRMREVSPLTGLLRASERQRLTQALRDTTPG
jgi:hypothetical protein